MFYLFFSRLGHPPFGRVLLAECTGHCPDQLLDSLAQSELTRKAISVLCPDDKLCVCVCLILQPLPVLSFQAPFFPFFTNFCHSFCFAFTSLIFSADELELLTEGLDLLGVDPTGYDDEDD